MSQGIVASVQCPACGQAFLCQQQNAAGMVSCPHCARHAPRSAFITHGHVAAVSQERRRVSAAPEEQPMVAPSPEAAEWARQQFAPAAPEFTPQPQSPSAPQKSASQSQMQWHSLPDRPVDQGVVPGTVQEVDEDFVPEHLKPSPWPWVAAFAILTTLMGGGLWVWMEHRAEQGGSETRWP
ncbi:MAG: hypothetical protein IPK32_08505 [Verrucomicrobiaceae bacterium]|nr:hypothetical protein [Verrucomicrobiaceae bacterium]